MNKTYTILKTIAYVSALIMCLVFYSWHLFIILMLFGWGMNLENSNGKPRTRL